MAKSGGHSDAKMDKKLIKSALSKAKISVKMQKGGKAKKGK